MLHYVFIFILNIEKNLYEILDKNHSLRKLKFIGLKDIIIARAVLFYFCNAGQELF